MSRKLQGHEENIELNNAQNGKLAPSSRDMGVDWSDVDLQLAQAEANKLAGYHAAQQRHYEAVANSPADDRPGATIAVFRHKSFIGKKFGIGQRGELIKQTSAMFYDGRVEVLGARTAADLAQIIENLDPQHDALSLGRLRDGRTSARVMTNSTRIGDAVARTQEYFAHGTGPGWVLLDLDAGSMPGAVLDRIEALGGPLRALHHVLPEIAGASVVIRASSSGGVHRAGDEPGEIRGWHVFVMIAEAARAELFLREIQARCWQEGLAYFAISASGARLERGLIDLSVSGPERLIFEADPVLGRGVERDVPPMQHREGTPLGELPGVDLDAAALLRQEAYDDAEAKARAQRDEWLRERVALIQQSQGISAEAALKLVSALLDGGVIHDETRLPMADGSFRRAGDVLDEVEAAYANGKRGVLESLPDPTEGAQYGSDKLVVYWRDGATYPDATSFAHGQRKVYKFARYAQGGGSGGGVLDEGQSLADAREAKRVGQLKTVPGTMRDFIGEWIETAVEPAIIENAMSIEVTRQRTEELTALGVEEVDALDEKERANHMSRTAQRASTAVRDSLGLPGRPRIKRHEQPLLDEGGYHVYGPHDYPGQRAWSPGVPHNALVNGAQGIGKTTAVVDTVASLQGGNVLFCAPSGELAREVVERLESAVADLDAAGRYEATETKPPAIFHRRGRGAEVEGAPLCAFIDATTEIAKAGVPVRTTACAACPLRDTCSYMAQEEAIAASLVDKTRATIVIGDHTHALMPLPGGDAADALIVDEQIRDLGSVEFRVKLDKIGNLPDLRPAPFDNEKLKEELDATPDNSSDAAPWETGTHAEIKARHIAEHEQRENDRQKSNRAAQIIMRAVANALTDQQPHSKPLLKLQPHRDAMAAAAKELRQRSDRALGAEISEVFRKADTQGVLPVDIASRVRAAVSGRSPYPYATAADLLDLLVCQIDLCDDARERLMGAAAVSEVRRRIEGEVEKLKADAIAAATCGDMETASALMKQAAEMKGDIPVSQELLWRVPGMKVVDDGKHKVLTWKDTARLAHNGAPTLLMDGTGEIEVARALLPDVVEKRFEVERNAHVTVVVGRSFSKRELVGSWTSADGGNHGDRGDAGRAAANRERTVLAMTEYAHRHGVQIEKVFVGTSMKIEELMKPILPADVVTGHFGAVRGVNRAEHCELAVLVGEHYPPEDAVRDLAAGLMARTTVDIGQLGGVNRQNVVRYAFDGNTFESRTTEFGVPMMDAVFRSIRDSEALQAIDRVRPIYNTRRIVIFANSVPVGLHVDEVIHIDELTGDREGLVDKCLEEKGIFVLNRRECADVLPGLVSQKSARNAFEAGASLVGPSHVYSIYDVRGPNKDQAVNLTGDTVTITGNRYALTTDPVAGAKYDAVSYWASPEKEGGRRKQLTALIRPGLSDFEALGVLSAVYAETGRAVSDVRITGSYIPDPAAETVLAQHRGIVHGESIREAMRAAGVTPPTSIPSEPYPGGHNIRLQNAMLPERLRGKRLVVRPMPEEGSTYRVAGNDVTRTETTYTFQMTVRSYRKQANRANGDLEMHAASVVNVRALSEAEARAKVRWPSEARSAWFFDKGAVTPREGETPEGITNEALGNEAEVTLLSWHHVTIFEHDAIPEIGVH